MSFKSALFYVVIVPVFFSCTSYNKFPERQTEKIVAEQVILNHPVFSETSSFAVDSLMKNDHAEELNKLLIFKQYYENRDEQFDLTELEVLWINLKNRSTDFNFEDTRGWIEITGFLMEITGKELYAQELENIVNYCKSSLSQDELKKTERLLTPWIFTKNNDHIHVNLFVNATIKYDHSLKGAVEITQETTYPESEKVIVKFKMENKRLIDLYIRIPEWANGATVTEKGVKYVAIPGNYTVISRKWSDGDFVEINLPVDKMPKQ